MYWSPQPLISRFTPRIDAVKSLPVCREKTARFRRAALPKNAR